MSSRLFRVSKTVQKDDEQEMIDNLKQNYK